MPGTADARAQLAAEAAMDAARQQAIDAAVAEAGGREAGTMPGFIQALVEMAETPSTVSWTRILSRCMRTDLSRASGADDYSRGRPSKRQGSVGWDDGAPLLPRMVGADVRALLAIDTSGSMSDAALAEIVREVDRCCRAGGVRLDVLTHDTRVVQVWRDIDGSTTIKRDGLGGRGGTNFHPVFEWIAEQRERYALVVMATDGEGPAPIEAPRRTSVVWLLNDEDCESPVEWGRCITRS
jgi:predicted metal-dependent peptidase